MTSRSTAAHVLRENGFAKSEIDLDRVIHVMESKKIKNKISEAAKKLQSEQLELIQARMQFHKDYCELKGWNPKQLKMKQIQEIQSQEEWESGKRNVN